MTSVYNPGGSIASPAPTPLAAAVPAAMEIRDLTVGTGNYSLVQSLSLSVAPGETLCLVGESGCGKSLTCMSALMLLTAPLSIKSGSIKLFGEELVGRPEYELNAMRGRDAAMIFQNPMASLNPVQRVGRQIAESILIHSGKSAQEAEAETLALLEHVGIPDPARNAQAYPHQLSGGMCQRVMIAMALACHPRLLIADEPTTALDVTIQAQILKLLKRLQAETGMALVFVTHDLGVVAEIADTVAVMYAGRVVEQGTADDLFERPAHPYTQALMRCRVQGGRASAGRLESIEGVVPSPRNRPAGCAFAPRCPKARPICGTTPALAPVPGTQSLAACHFASKETAQ
ncbi:MAG: oligopeptide/dipeptide transporter, ATP-binding protein [Rhizobium sp.]|nr:oligopeptide/dipeptide transporter, ATP-binding protein [Rhizobium sp.]